jgi:hypothetical protein
LAIPHSSIKCRDQPSRRGELEQARMFPRP